MVDAHNSAKNTVPIEDRYESSRWPLFVALGAGIITAVLSASLEHRVALFYGDVGFIVTAVFFPGLLGSIAIAGSAHAFSLWIAAGINFFFYFALIWIIALFLFGFFAGSDSFGAARCACSA